MNTTLKTRSCDPGNAVPGSGEVSLLKEITGRKIVLQSFSLSDLVLEIWEKLSPKPAIEWSIHSEISVQSDLHLIRTALRLVLEQAATVSRENQSSKLRFTLQHMMTTNKIMLTGPGCWLSAADLAMTSARPMPKKPSEDALGMYMVRLALNRVKARVDLLNPRAGGSQVTIEIPNVSGEAS